MPTFHYTAKDRGNNHVRGSLEAASRKEALRLLSARGFMPVSLAEGGSGSAAKPRKSAPANKGAPGRFGMQAPRRKWFHSHAEKPSKKHRLPFLVAVSELTHNGLSVGEALRLLALRVSDPALRQLCSGIWEQIGEGATFFGALKAYPEVFDESTVNLIEAGEATGNINNVLTRLIEHLRESKEMRWQFIASMAYPLFLMFVAGAVILFFLLFLFPRLEALFTALRGELPASTKFLLWLADFTINYGTFVLLGLVLIAAGIARWYAMEKGRMAIDSFLLKLPVVGPFCVARTVYVFSQTLAMLLENGITTADALKMTERQISNRAHRASFAEATGKVLEGEPLSKALARTNSFPDLVLDQLTLGENTGNLAPSLRRVADNFGSSLKKQTKTFTQLLGTAVLLVVFVFVGFVALAIISAIFELSSSIRG